MVVSAGMEKYSVVCQIGKGACGAVYLVRSKENKKLYALKKIELDETRKTRTKLAVQREANIMAELRHPHIVTYHESFFDEQEKHLCIIQDYCDGGTLEDKIREMQQKQTKFPEKQVIQWFLQIAMAVRYMHSKRVLHRDLKTPNVFLNKSGTLCKLGDFGIAKTMDTTIEVASTCVGTPCYLSPEMCQDIPYTSKADVWALGCMLYEMCALKPAFDAHNLISLFYKIVKAEYEPISDSYSADMHHLVAAVLCKLPEERPSARGVLAMPYLRKELLKFIEEKEFILQQRRVPTRQGSRPYSTPTLSRSFSEPDAVEASSSELLPSQAKRAISCRPTLTTTSPASSSSSSSTVKDPSLFIPPPKSSKSRSGRVSTIPEETEDQLLERSLRLNASLNFSQGHQGLRLQLDKLREEDEQIKIKVPDSVTPRRLAKLQNGDITKIQKKETNSNINQNGVSLTARSSTPDRIEKLQNEEKRSRSESPRFVSRNDKNVLHEVENINNLEMKKKERRKSAKGNVELVPIDSPRRSKEGSKTSRKSKQSPPQDTGRKTPKLPEIDKKAKLTITKEAKGSVNKKSQQNSIKETSSPRKVKVQEPQKTPRSLESKPPIIPELPGHNNKVAQRTLAVPENVHRSGRRRSSTRERRERKDGRSARSKGSSRGGNASRENTEVYYSDDFDEDSSGSEIEEDIPEEVSSEYSSIRGRSYSFTQGSDVSKYRIGLDFLEEIPDIPEDLPDGQEAVDLDDLSETEEIDEDIDEEDNADLDTVVSVAREAHQELNHIYLDDDTIIDSDHRITSANHLIQKHCRDVLGEEQFEKLKTYVYENNNMPEGPEMRKIAKMLGQDNMKTMFLMSELSQRNDPEY